MDDSAIKNSKFKNKSKAIINAARLFGGGSSGEENAGPDELAACNVSKTLPSSAQGAIEVTPRTHIMSATERFFDTIRQLDSKEGSQAVKKVDIYAANIGDAGSLKLAASIKRNYTLKILNAGSNCIGDEGGTAIAKALEKNSSIHTLRLQENSIGNDAVLSFGHTLTLNNISLRVLDLSANAIYDDGAITLAQTFKTKSHPDRNCSLTALHLSSNHIGNLGAVEFSHVLRTNASLTLLDLSRCRIADAGGVSFAQDLHFNTHLQTLNLSFNGFSHALGEPFIAALTKRSELLKLSVEGQGILHDALSRITALGPKPPPPPTKWVRPAAQGEVDVLAAQMAEMKRNQLKAAKLKSTVNTPLFKSTINDAPLESIVVAPERGPGIPSNALGKFKKRSKSIINVARLFGSSFASEEDPTPDASTPDAFTNASHIKGNISRTTNVQGAIRVTRLADEVLVPKDTDSAGAPIQNHDRKPAMDATTVPAVTSKVNQFRLRSKSIITAARMLPTNPKPAILAESPMNRPVVSAVTTSLDPDTMLRTAQIKASLIVADAQAIAADMLLEAQKQLAKVLIASKANPVSFEVANQQAIELATFKARLGSSKLEFSTENEASIGFLDTQNKDTSAPLSGTSSFVSADFNSVNAHDLVPKHSMKSTGDNSIPKSPLGFQKCKLAEQLAARAAEAASEVVAATAAAAVVAAELIAAEARVLSEVSPLQIFREQLKSFSVSSIGGYGSYSGVGLSETDSLVHGSIKFVSLESLPFLEMEHLPELCAYQDITSTEHTNCSIEVTGPLWNLKLGETDELNGLPERFAVKQFFEEIRSNFIVNFSLYNSIQGQGHVPITHILASGGVPVGLVMEHLPLSLDDAMHSMAVMDAICVLEKCAAALHSLHVSGISHSNISTSAFVLSNNFRTVKLAEFAIDQCVLNSLGFVHEQDPFFAAPEFSNGNNAPSVLTDVYAFGALIWRVLHPLNQRPLGNVPIAVSLAAARGTMPIFSRIGIPTCISDICHFCMAADPKVRPQTLRDVVLALIAAQDMLVHTTRTTIAQLLGNGKDCQISCLSRVERGVVEDDHVELVDECIDGDFAKFVLSRARGSEEEREMASQVQSFFVKFSAEKAIPKTSSCDEMNAETCIESSTTDCSQLPAREVFEISRISRVIVPSDREAHW